MRRQDHHHFPRNLRTLLGQYPTVSQAADELGINRQQLNKYLNGQGMPSLATLQAIARHFGLGPDDLLLPADRFAQRWRPPPRLVGLPAGTTRAFNQLVDNMAKTRLALAPYCGVYHAYLVSRAAPGKIIRACSVIGQDGDVTTIKTVYFLTNAGERRTARVPNKINGIVQMLGERIYMLDVQNVGKAHARIQSVILYPPPLPSVPVLSGILLTANNAQMRPIYSTKIIFQRVSSGPLRKSDLAICGVYNSDAPEIPDTIQHMMRFPVMPL